MYSFGCFNAFSLAAQFIIELHFNNGFANRGHCCPQIHIWSEVFQPTANVLRANKVTGLLPVIHEVVQLLITGAGLLKHAHSKPVLVQVVVVGHGEHDGHALSARSGMSVEQVVGQHPDGA